jgi:hypothetical protein
LKKQKQAVEIKVASFAGPERIIQTSTHPRSRWLGWWQYPLAVCIGAISILTFEAHTPDHRFVFMIVDAVIVAALLFLYLMAYIDHRREIRRLTADLESALIGYRQELKRLTADINKVLKRRST